MANDAYASVVSVWSNTTFRQIALSSITGHCCDGGTCVAVTSSKLLNQCFTDVPDDIISYLSKHFLRLNVTAIRQRWTNNNCEAINHVLRHRQSIQWRPQQLLFVADRQMHHYATLWMWGGADVSLALWNVLFLNSWWCKIIR